MMFFFADNGIRFPEWISDTAIPLPGPLAIKWYGLAYVVGIIIAYLYAVRTVRKKELWIPEGVTRGTENIPTKAMLEDFATWCLIGIIVGGRMGSLILYDPPETFLDIFKVWEGGMAFHGGFLGVCAAVWYMSKKYKISIWRWADLVAIGAANGIFLGRIANFTNQELPGRVTDVPWAIKFWGGNNDQLPRHPSQLYEAFLEGIVIFVVLWFVSRKTKALTKPGVCAALFILMYGIFRTFVEFFREPDAIWQIHPYFTRGMLYSTPMIIIGLGLFLWAKKRPPVAPRHLSDDS